MDLAILSQQRQSIDQLNHESPRPQRRRFHPESFDSSHKRLTTYLRNDTFAQIQSLRDSGGITNLTEFFNEAVCEYLKCHFA